MNHDRIGLLESIDMEVDRAKLKYPTFHSTHEGYAVLLEEVHELWDLVRANKGVFADDRMRRECIQIASMAVRFIEDLAKD